MADRNERDVLNHLIETCKDGARGYRFAADHLKTPGTKSLFLEMASQRDRFAADLIPFAQRLGGHDAADGTMTGALHRRWMAVIDTLGHHDESRLIAEADRGEEAAETAYKDAIEGMLPPTARDLVEQQYNAIRSAHQTLRASFSL
jgi:uncharacterized protein (TIGR02284 family)